MKLKALLLALAVAGAGSSFALADDGHGGHGDHHKSSSTTTSSSSSTTTSTTTTTTTTPSNCQRIQLRGTLASVSATSFTLNVQRANDAGQSLVGRTVTIGVDANTSVEWEGNGTLTGPNAGDQARVKALSCPAATAGAATLTAMSVRAHGASGGQHDNLKSHR